VSERLLTACEIAELLNVPETWVREHTRSGSIPHVVLGRYRRYDPDEVLAWVASLKGGGGPRFRRYDPTTRNGPRGAETPEGPTPKE
jgi:excisionase family DNA binding protein